MKFFTTLLRRSWLLPLLVALLLPVTAEKTADEWFQELDLDHNGLLEKPEFVAGYPHLRGDKKKWAWKWDKGDTTQTTTRRPDNFLKAFTTSFVMIVATELGDKTFFIAAVLSMKHDRSAIFGGALLALIIMTVLSTAMGLVLPNLLSRKYTVLVSAILFLYFGVKLLYEARGMTAGKASEELEEVEEELLLQSNKKKVDEADNNNDDNDDIEQQNDPSEKQKLPRRRRRSNWLSVALQALTLTFLAEWGDRSQIATIALASSHHAGGVTVGGCLGHASCTGLAVLGGRILASRISEKTVALSGGILFLLFGLHSLFMEV